VGDVSEKVKQESKEYVSLYPAVVAVRLVVPRIYHVSGEVSTQSLYIFRD
jgi:hypothetical protein